MNGVEIKDDFGVRYRIVSEIGLGRGFLGWPERWYYVEMETVSVEPVLFGLFHRTHRSWTSVSRKYRKHDDAVRKMLEIIERQDKINKQAK